MVMLWQLPTLIFDIETAFLHGELEGTEIYIVGKKQSGVHPINQGYEKRGLKFRPPVGLDHKKMT
jgi:hypothetical protein